MNNRLSPFLTKNTSFLKEHISFFEENITFLKENINFLISNINYFFNETNFSNQNNENSLEQNLVNENNFNFLKNHIEFLKEHKDFFEDHIDFFKNHIDFIKKNIDFFIQNINFLQSDQINNTNNNENNENNEQMEYWTGQDYINLQDSDYNYYPIDYSLPLPIGTTTFYPVNNLSSDSSDPLVNSMSNNQYLQPEIIDHSQNNPPRKRRKLKEGPTDEERLEDLKKLGNSRNLSRDEINEMKKLKRKIDNKKSAKESRERKKATIISLEEKIQQLSAEIKELQVTTSTLEREKKLLINEVKYLNKMIHDTINQNEGFVKLKESNPIAFNKALDMILLEELNKNPQLPYLVSQFSMFTQPSGNLPMENKENNYDTKKHYNQ